MNILWITNLTFPEAQVLLCGKGEMKASGGWMLGAAEALVQRPDIKLYVGSVSPKVKRLTRLEGEKITYYLLPYGKGNHRINHDYEPLWRQVRDEVQPDVVHLHGTEFSHGLAYIEACGTNNVCVSIQGLVSACYTYYCYGLSAREIIRATTLSSLLRGGVMKGCRDFRKRAECEKEIIRRVHNIIGRTQWDRERTWAINPDVEYHYCGEILRSAFYAKPRWQYASCNPHSIFLSQASYPIKGLHMVLRAMPLVLRHYPDAMLRIAGPDISCSSSWRERLRLGNYGKIIHRLIQQNGLQNKVYYTGPLDENGMKREYLRSNVFVCPSSIENSPNSLGEAQLLGVPVLASYVGGVPDMMHDDEEHLYRFEEVEMLAYKIVQLFDLQNEIDTKPMQRMAQQRHNPNTVVERLLCVYQMVENK